MDDPAFEMRLGRLFAETPPLPDAHRFAGEIESRLGRGWALRRVLIAVAGVSGGVIAVGQAIGSGLASRIGAAARMMAAARQGVSHLPSPIDAQLSILGDMPFGGEVMWMVGGLAILAAALFAGRSLKEF